MLDPIGSAVFSFIGTSGQKNRHKKSMYTVDSQLISKKSMYTDKEKFSAVDFQNILNHDNLSRQFLDSIGYKPSRLTLIGYKPSRLTLIGYKTSRLTLIKDTNNSKDTLTDNQNIPGDISSKPRTGP